MNRTILNRLIARLYACTGLALGLPLALTVDKIETITDAAQRTLYVEKDGKWHLDVTGLEDTSGLKTSLQKERDASRAATEKAKTEEAARKALEKKYEGIDPDSVRALLGQFENAEEAALLTKGKEGFDTLLAKRTEKQRLAHEKDLKAAKDETVAAVGRLSKYQGRVLDNEVRAAVVKAGVHVTAIDDALLRARSVFTLDEDGNAVALDKDGERVMGKDGKTPFSAAEWIEGMKESAPHWFPTSNSGGGSQGGKGGDKGTMKRSVFEALDAAGRAKVAKDGTKIVD